MARLAETPRRMVAPGARWALVGLLALTVVGVALGAASFARPQLEAYPSVVTFPLSDVPEVEPVFYRPFDMGQSKHNIQYGIYLVRDGDRVLALYSNDHESPRRCAIEEVPEAQRTQSELSWFISGTTSGYRWQSCPSWRWTRTGVRVFGGARDMDRFDTQIIDGMVHIDVSRLRIGECGNEPSILPVPRRVPVLDAGAAAVPRHALAGRAALLTSTVRASSLWT